MKKISAFLCLFLISLLFGGCITYEKISPPTSGTNQEKISRFDYMEGNWSYFNNRWIRNQKVKPELLVRTFSIPYDQAKAEEVEFVESQYNYNWFHRFLISIYLNQPDFYID